MNNKEKQGLLRVKVHQTVSNKSTNSKTIKHLIGNKLQDLV